VAIHTVPTHDPRITAIIFDSSIGSILFASVYMPKDYQDEDSLVNYMDVCGELNSLISNNVVFHTFLAADFNCHSGSRFYINFTHLIDDCSLVVSDIKRLSFDTFTYINDSGCNMSWIDHILCSSAVDNLIVDMHVLHDFVSSDHKPLSVSLANLTCKRIYDPTSSAAEHVASLDDAVKRSYCWKLANDDSLHMYSSLLNDYLCNIDIPVDLLPCCNNLCHNSDHLDSIVKYFDAIQSSIQQSVNPSIPSRLTIT